MIRQIFLLDISFFLVIFFNICASVSNPPNESNSGAIYSKTRFSSFDNEPDPRFYYALDPRSTRRLAITEERLVTSLIALLNKISTEAKRTSCYTELQNYLNEFNKDTKVVKRTKNVPRADVVTDNPNLSLRMMRRLVVTLLNDTVNSCKGSVPEIETTINSTFAATGLTLPIDQDLDEALMGLLRIHFVYGFNATTEIRLGIFNGLKTGALLYFEDSLALAKKAIKEKAVVLTYQWLVAATIGIVEMKKNEQSRKNIKDLENLWSNLQNILEFGNLKEVHRLLQNRTQNQFSEFFEYKYYATCREELVQTLAYQSKLRCFHQFDWDPYFYINPVKTEVLSGHPLIYQFYDFVSDSTIGFIKNSTNNLLSRSGIKSRNGSEIDFSSQRNAMNAWFADKNGTKFIPQMATLSRRIEKLTGLNVLKHMASEPLKVLMYGSLGGHHDFHFDSQQITTLNIDREGDRLATFIIFFSTVKMGGFTAFPRAGTFARPIKGSAIFWYNIKQNGEIDERTEHGGCPVVLGRKEIGNRWILQYENMFKEPCSLDPLE